MDDAIVEEVPVEEPKPEPKKAKKAKNPVATRDKTGRIVFE